MVVVVSKIYYKYYRRLCYFDETQKFHQLSDGVNSLILQELTTTHLFLYQLDRLEYLRRLYYYVFNTLINVIRVIHRIPNNNLQLLNCFFSDLS